LHEDVAIVGSSDSVSYFRILGCRCFETQGGEMTDDIIAGLEDGDFEIIFVTEEIFTRYRDFFRGEKKFAGSAVTIIPDIRGARWEAGKPLAGSTAREEIREAVIKAVGQDVSNSVE